MTSFTNIDIDCKLLSLTISYQFKTVYINFQARNDIFYDHEVNQHKLIPQWERARLKLNYSDLSEVLSLKSFFDNQIISLKAVLRLIDGKYIPEIAKDYSNKDIKVLKILSLEKKWESQRAVYLVIATFYNTHFWVYYQDQAGELLLTWNFLFNIC